MIKVRSSFTVGAALLLASLLAQPSHAYTIKSLKMGEGELKSPYLLTCNDGFQCGVGLDNHGNTVSPESVAAVSKEVCKTHGGMAKAPSDGGKPGWQKGLPALVLVADEPMRAGAFQGSFTSTVSVLYPTCPAGWTLVANAGADTCPAPTPLPACPPGKNLVQDKDGDGKRDLCQ